MANLAKKRAGAILVMLLAAAGTYGVATASAFGFSQMTLDGAIYTTRAEVTTALGLTSGEPRNA